MPPKSGAKSTRGGAGRGGKASSGPARGGGAGGPSGGGRPQSAIVHWTQGEKRPKFATVGVKVEIEVNAFPVEINSQTVHQYDVVLIPSTTSREFNGRILRKVQDDNPTIFTAKAGYDGRAILVSPKRLNFAGGQPSGSIFVAMPSRNTTKPPDPFEVKLTHAGEVNLESLEEFIFGGQNRSNESLTGVTVSLPQSRCYPCLPGLSSTLMLPPAMMYRTGNLLELCIDVAEVPYNTGATFFTPGHANYRDDRRRLVERFITGVKVLVPTTGNRPRTVRGLTSQAASALRFDMNGKSTTVAAYFKDLGHQVSTPQVICAQIGERAFVPLVLCTVTPDQLIKKQIPAHKTNNFVDFARLTPSDRFAAIRDGVKMLGHTQSEYVKAFGMKIEENSMLRVMARRLNALKLLHGARSRVANAAPINGSWNMADKTVHQPCRPLKHWIAIIFEPKFTDANYNDSIRDLMAEAKKLGMTIEAPPARKRANSGGDILGQLRTTVVEYAKANKTGPQMLFVIIPDGSDQLRIQVKWFGTFTTAAANGPPGVATQCVKAFKCRGARPQYWANVLIQMNAKLGGINFIPDPSQDASLADLQRPTIVMGADVAHPSPGPDGPPSFAALVWSIDRNHMKYNARDSVQPGRREIIEDIGPMVKYAFKNHYQLRKVWPIRLIFFRETQFEAVKDQEVFRELKAENPAFPVVKITYYIVGKRHHVRFNAVQDKDKDRKSGNVLAGTVIDTDITHPVENDFYLLSHGGIIGTSRPAHYSIIHDENNFSYVGTHTSLCPFTHLSLRTDQQEELSYSLCHGYASCTRSVSIPIPVYYADKACEYAKYRFPPNRPMAPNPDGNESGQDFFAKLKAEFDGRPLSAYAANNMYFAVSPSLFVV
ncbi:eukaryotic translation initiation factor 2C [Coprinopsis sp. MPI-PUGE-AT-0042]|nr:eukaryotic translation initiation factor 2C [Coprinopsis sp. MPI-PUGE-AT-0042]